MNRPRAAAAAIRWSMVPWAGVAGLVATLAGCKQGPDFFSPLPPEEAGYTAPGQAVPPELAVDGKRGAAQRVAVGAKVQEDWWTLFRSPALNQVIKQALADSPTIAQATAQLAAAREQVTAVAGGTLPQFDLAAGISRQQFNPAPSGVNRVPVPVSVYAVGPSVSYTVDVFGSLARQIEGQAARADVSSYQLAAAYLSLTGNITAQAITIAGLRAQIRTVESIIAEDQKIVGLVKTQQAGGTATMVDVTTAQSQLANDRTLLPPLHQQLAVARDALAVYTGKTPAAWSPPDFDLRDLTLPKIVPLSLPTELVRQRPDILAAEAQLHAAAADVGVATANLYPHFTLNASVTQSAIDLGNFFSGLYTAFNIGANMAAPIFHGGTLRAQQRAAKDTFDATWAAYRQTVISSFGQVADLLQAVAHDDEALRTQTAALASAREAVRLARLSYSAGNTTLLQLLDPERQERQAQLGVVRAQTQRLADTAQLMVALGSGWWNTPPSTPATAPPPSAPDNLLGHEPPKAVPPSPTSGAPPPQTVPPEEMQKRWP